MHLAACNNVECEKIPSVKILRVEFLKHCHVVSHYIYIYTAYLQRASIKYDVNLAFPSEHFLLHEILASPLTAGNACISAGTSMPRRGGPPAFLIERGFFLKGLPGTLAAPAWLDSEKKITNGKGRN